MHNVHTHTHRKMGHMACTRIWKAHNNAQKEHAMYEYQCNICHVWQCVIAMITLYTIHVCISTKALMTKTWAAAAALGEKRADPLAQKRVDPIAHAALHNKVDNPGIYNNACYLAMSGICQSEHTSMWCGCACTTQHTPGVGPSPSPFCLSPSLHIHMHAVHMNSTLCSLFRCTQCSLHRCSFCCHFFF